MTAASAEWQITGEPIFYDGNFYYPTGPTVFFDGQVMTRTGVYKGVPLYQDRTLEPYSVVFVPIGGMLMRPYERRRAGELAGTTGSRTPSFPIEHEVEVSAASGMIGIQIPPVQGTLAAVVPYVEGQPTAVAPVGSGQLPTAPSAAMQAGATPEAAPFTRIESIPPPTANRGVWVEFEGARWYSAGPAVPYDDDRFVPSGDIDGFPVYRLKNGAADEIYVAVTIDGPVAPYRR
jgi:hypothetical protein